MRRSKSNPAKYLKNYNKISQRKMSTHTDNDKDILNEIKKEKEEIEKLFLKDSLSIVNNSDDKNVNKKKRKEAWQ